MRAAAALTLAFALAASACGDSPLQYEAHWMDGPEVSDPSLNSPGYSLSTRPGMTAADLTRPVVIAVHGYSASTFEWQEFRDYAEGGSDVLVSLVLLGGHGRSVEEDFAPSTWRQWGQPILDEYAALVAQGYTRISIATASTGGALLLEQLAAGHYAGDVRPRQLFLVDPIVIPTDKALTLIPFVRHLISAVQTDGTEEERAHWYSNRPPSTLAELYELTERVRSRLASGYRLPAGTAATVYKTSRDPTADPVSALLIYRGLRTSEGGRIAVQMFDSPLHVFTRLAARAPTAVTAADRQRQQQVFDEMLARASE
jgi:carboxylesterase